MAVRGWGLGVRCASEAKRRGYEEVPPSRLRLLASSPPNLIFDCLHAIPLAIRAVSSRCCAWRLPGAAPHLDLVGVLGGVVAGPIAIQVARHDIA